MKEKRQKEIVFDDLHLFVFELLFFSSLFLASIFSLMTFILLASEGVTM